MKIKLLACIATVAAFCVGNAHAFGSPEHRDIGDSAWQLALSTLTPADVTKLLQNTNLSAVKGTGGHKDEPVCAVANGKPVVCFSFGDLVAIYGDFATSTTDVNSTAIVARAPALKQIAIDGNVAAYPSEKTTMINLAKDNYAHFSGDALQAYVQNHSAALTAAKDPTTVWQALHYEALALHSFTDLFAFGHMIEDRELTKALVDWANKDGSYGSSLLGNAGSSAMGGMVNFYHNAGNWQGAMVKNANGDQWKAYGDGKYFDPAYSGQRTIAVKAAAASLWSVINVALGNPLPAGTTYYATRFLPYQYWGGLDPIEPKDQKLALAKLIVAMQLAGRPIQDNGFDFSMGYLKYQTPEKKGTVKYLDALKALQGM
jgi:hypothetical protein